MDLVQLRYFMTVAEAGHLTNAAKKLNVAQPALSVSIARLEKEVGVPLFDRVGRNIYLNKCGEIYLEYVEQVLDIMNRAQKEVDTYCQKLENVLNLGIVSKPFSWQILSAFKERYPDSKIRQVEIGADSVEEELRKDEVDYVISSCLNSASGIVAEVIWEETMMLAVPAGHPLANREWVRLKDARNEEFINLPKAYEYRTITDAMCQDSGFTANVTTEGFHCYMPDLIAAGKGVALMTRGRAIQNAGNPQVVFIPIKEPEYTRNHYIMWKAGHHFNKMAREFRKFLRAYYEEHMDGEGFSCI